MKVLKHLKAKTQIAGLVLYLVSSLQEKKRVCNALFLRIDTI